jgi:hypothetical protein
MMPGDRRLSSGLATHGRGNHWAAAAALISVAVTAALGAQDARSDAGETAVAGDVYPC